MNRNFRNYSRLFLLTSAMIIATSCSDNENPPVEPTLYDKLGGYLKVNDPRNPGQMIDKGRLSFRSVVDSTITIIVSDIVAGEPGNLGAHFSPILGEVSSGNATNVAVLSKNLTDFFCANTGGEKTNTYTGLNMFAAHNPAMNPRMGVKSTNADYTKFIGYVGTAAQRNGVTDSGIINDVVNVLESLRAPIVQAP